MIRQIVIGTLVTMVAVAVQAEMLAFFGSRQQRIRSFLHRMLGRFAATGTIITGVFYIMLINTFHVWLRLQCTWRWALSRPWSRRSTFLSSPSPR